VRVKLGAKLEPKYRAVDNTGRQFRCSILTGFRAKFFHQPVAKPTRGQCILHLPSFGVDFEATTGAQLSARACCRLIGWRELRSSSREFVADGGGWWARQSTGIFNTSYAACILNTTWQLQLEFVCTAVGLLHLSELMFVHLGCERVVISMYVLG
jgi:hypothetical protein